MKISAQMKMFFSSFLLLPLLGGCSPKQAPNTSASIANPASVYCKEKGGKTEIVKDEAGEKGMCHLPDGTVVEEWELFRREHPQK
jgi:putative hemolysin